MERQNRSYVDTQIYDAMYKVGVGAGDIEKVMSYLRRMKLDRGNDELIWKSDAMNALIEKGQRSRRYKLGDIWELNSDEIHEALDDVPSAKPDEVLSWVANDWEERT